MEHYDHPILYIRNPVDKGIKTGRKMVCLSRERVREHKEKANRKNRRLVKQALKGNKIRCNKLPGNSWDLY